jgi:hypothetical protein
MQSTSEPPRQSSTQLICVRAPSEGGWSTSAPGLAHLANTDLQSMRRRVTSTPRRLPIPAPFSARREAHLLAHICAGTALAAATSAPGLGSALPCHICARTGKNGAVSQAGPGHRGTAASGCSDERARAMTRPLRTAGGLPADDSASTSMSTDGQPLFGATHSVQPPQEARAEPECAGPVFGRLEASVMVIQRELHSGPTRRPRPCGFACQAARALKLRVTCLAALPVPVALPAFWLRRSRARGGTP